MNAPQAHGTFYDLPNNPFHDSHFWADWVELVCVGNVDGSIDRSSIAKRARSHKKDLGEAGAATDDGDEGASAEESDKWTARVEEWFRHFEMRTNRLKDAYPFELSSDLSSISLRANLTPLQKFYLLLLMASSLRYFPQNESDITASFELISLEAMKKLLPQGAEAHLFGANKLKAGKFGADLWANLEVLRDELIETLKVAKGDFAEPDRGDNGLDLVGWFRLEEGVPGLLAMFGQCACTKEWDRKQSTSSASRWSSTMTFMTDPLNSVFVPLCLRGQTAKWHRPQDMMRDTLVIDRFRLLLLLKSELPKLAALPAFGAVDKFLGSKEAVA